MNFSHLFVNSRDRKSNPSGAHAKDFVNAVQRRPEQKKELKNSSTCNFQSDRRRWVEGSEKSCGKLAPASELKWSNCGKNKKLRLGSEEKNLVPNMKCKFMERNKKVQRFWLFGWTTNSEWILIHPTPINDFLLGPQTQTYTPTHTYIHVRPATRTHSPKHTHTHPCPRTHAQTHKIITGIEILFKTIQV